MATFEDKFNKLAQDFAAKIPVYEYYGKVRAISFEYNLDGVLAAGDKVIGVELPVNAKILDAMLQCPSMGATGIFTLGIKDSVSENTDGLIKLADAGGQAVLERADKDSNLIGTLLVNKSNLLLSVTETTIATAGKIFGVIYLSVE